MYLRHVRALSWFSQSPDGLLHDAPANPGGGAAVAEPPASGTPSPAGTPASSGAAPAASGTPSPTGAAPTGSSREPEDRSRWIPPHRLVEETNKRSTLQREFDRLQAQYGDMDRKLKIALGVQTQTPEQQEAEGVKRAFYAMFPQYEKLTPEFVDKMIARLEAGDDGSSAATTFWDNHASRTLRTLESKYLGAVGGESLTERQRDKLQAAFMQTARRDPETFRRRYESEDETLLDEFVKEWTEDYIDPVRRQSASDAIAPRRPVPRSGPSQSVTTAPPQIDFKDKQAVEDEAVRRMKENGLLRQR